MQINSVIPVIASGFSSKLAERLLSNILEAGLFRAIVVERKDTQVLLDTPWGRIKGKAPQETLKSGDEIFARLQSTRGGTGLQIVQHNPLSTRLPLQQMQQVFADNPLQPRAATFAGNDKDVALLQIGKNVYRVSGAQPFTKGDRLLLTPTDNRQVEIKRFDPQTMLKNALSVLLPKDPQRGNQLNVVDLITTLRSLVNAERPLSSPLATANVETRANAAPVQAQAQAQAPAPAPAPTPTATVPSPATAGQDTKSTSQPALGTPTVDVQTRQLEQVIRVLSSLNLHAAKLDGPAIQQILTTLTLLNPLGDSPTYTTQPLVQSLPQQLASLAEALRQQPELLVRVINNLSQQPSGQTATSQAETPAVERFLPLRNEFLQQTETLLTQITAQKVILGLQQESQQPLNISLGLPIQIERQTRELKIKIREQKSTNEEMQESRWEIKLSFEFGLLGLISTQLMLQGVSLSAHFWAEKISTKNLIDQHLDQFRGQLVRNGFEPGLLDCFHGTPGPEPSEKPELLESTNLLDLKA
jgi:hypothetical protein